MSKTKPFVLGGIVYLALLSVTVGALAQTDAAPPVEFRWAFAASVTSDGKSELQPITRDVALRSGDQLKMMIELQTRCYVYLFHYNAADGLKLLFPYSLQQFDADYRVRHKYYIPRGDAWFKLDDKPGQESFYLLASAGRVPELEADYLRYETAAAGEKDALARAVLDRVRSLRKQHREFTSPAERPVPIGGALRGASPFAREDSTDIAPLAEEVASTGFVARTYTIEHK